MSAMSWMIVAIIGFSFAGIAFAVAVFLFVKFDIPAVIGYLTGKTVAREIKAMKESDLSNRNKHFQSSKVSFENSNLNRKNEIPQADKKAMAIAHSSKRLDKINSDISDEFVGDIAKKDGGTVGLNDFEYDSTEVLDTDGELTEILNDGETEILYDSTTVLNDTTVLTSTEELDEAKDKEPVSFEITKSVIITHTDEVV